MKRWLAVGWAVVATGCGVAVGLAGCSSDDEQDGGSYAGSGGTGGTGGSTGGTGGSTGGTGGSTGGTGGSTGGTGGSTGGTGGTTGGTGGGISPAECVAAEPATLVPVTGGFSIDATEVTRCQYMAWLGTNPPTSGQPSYCDWNDNYTPSCEWPPFTRGDHPVTCVDWCDAYAYCLGVGKRLCGKIGGGANAWGDHTNASESQWYAACTSGGTNDYPYGDTYSATTCNGQDADHGTTVPVASMGGCQSSVSGYAGVYDLSGNVFEWEDSCNEDVGNFGICRLRGGSFDNVVSLLRCGFGADQNRELQNGGVGFRCCSSP